MYVELACRSNFSFLRGASDSRDYIKRAQELGMTAIGITDINGVYGLPRAFEQIRDFAPEVKLICGAEVTVQNFAPLTLIARTRKAWGILCRILTQVHAGKPKGEGFITYDELQFLTRRFPGREELVCLIESHERNSFEHLQTLFPDQLFLKLCRYLDGLDPKRTARCLELASRYHLPIVATNDVHYHIPEKQFLQDCLTCIREGTTLDRAGFKLFPNAERYLKSTIQMESLFHDLPEAILNTKRIADSCTFSLSELKYTYPKESVPAGETASSYLKKLVIEGAKERYKGFISADVDERIRRELAFFTKRGEEDYFLTIHDIIRTAKEKKIVFQGRGSAASSIVCYCLGITAIDPVHANLLFDRFANDARKDPPDIDVDFEHERREEIIQEIYQRYGRDRAGMVAAVHTYKLAGSYREICKAIGVEVGTLKADVVRSRFDELAREYANRKVFLDNLIQQIADFPRHVGTHSGGFLITNDPLVETVPVEPAAMDGRTIIQWDKHDLETLGMMKVDILSIGFLTVIRKTCDLIGLDWRSIPMDDPDTYRLIQKAQTAGCFQIESRAQMSSLPHTKPNSFYEMTIQVALIRPSMSVGGMARAYLKNRALSKRGQPFHCGNPAMDQILGRTHGVAMFPEQIMQIAMDVCHYTSAEADILRRSLGRERSSLSLEGQGLKLYNSLIKAGISEELSKDILSRTTGFSSYGFPEAHAASYGSLALKSAYLKTHYPAEFLCGLINSQPMGFYRIDFLISEAVRNSGVRVLPVHALNSGWDAKMEGPKTIRMGFRDVRRIRQEDVEHMLGERTRKQFESIEDFIARTSFDQGVLQNLTIANAFECFQIDRRHSFWKSLEFKRLMGQKQKSQQLSLFDESVRLEESPLLFQKMSELEEAVIDYRVHGYSLKGSLMKQLRLEIPSLPVASSKTIQRMKRNARVQCAGILLVDQRPPPAKGFGFITLEDEYGTLDLILRPDVYDKYKSIFRSSRFLIIDAKVQRLDDHITLLVETVESFAPNKKVRSHQPTPRMLDRIDWVEE